MLRVRDAARMRAHYSLDRTGQCAGRIAAAAGGQQDQTTVAPAVDQTLRRKRSKVLDVVRDDRPLLARGGIENLCIGRLRQLWSFDHGDDVETALAQELRDLIGEMLVQQGVQEASACLPASQAVYPRCHSASLVAISSSISSR